MVALWLQNVQADVWVDLNVADGEGWYSKGHPLLQIDTVRPLYFYKYKTIWEYSKTSEKWTLWGRAICPL